MHKQTNKLVNDKMNLEGMQIAISPAGCAGADLESRPATMPFIDDAERLQHLGIVFREVHVPVMDGCQPTSAPLKLHPRHAHQWSGSRNHSGAV